MRICKSCGAELAPGAKFCLECGSAADDAVETDLNETKNKDDKITKEADKEIEAVSEVLSEELPKVKEISIIKPKDISVLKPQKETYAKKAPAPVKENADNSDKNVKKQDLPPKKTYKKDVPDVELPEEPKAYVPEDTELDPSKVVMKSFVSDRENEDFSKGFYSDVKPEQKAQNNEAPKQTAEVSKPNVSVKPEKKKSSAPIIIAVIAIIAVACAAYFILTSGNNNNDDTEITVETYSEDVVTEETALSDTEMSETESAVSSSEENAQLEDTTTEAETTGITSAETETTAVSEETVSETSNSPTETALTFEHTQSVSGSEILSYTFGGDNFSVDNFTDNSVIKVTYTSAVTLSAGMSPINMTLSDGTNSVVIPVTSVDETTVTYAVSDINASLAAEGFAGDIKTVTTMSFNGVGMPVDITAISIS